MQLSQKRKIFSNFFFTFVNLDSILNIFKNKMTVITDVFLNIRTPKDVVLYMSKNSCFRGPFDK